MKDFVRLTSAIVCLVPILVSCVGIEKRASERITFLPSWHAQFGHLSLRAALEYIEDGQKRTIFVWLTYRIDAGKKRMSAVEVARDGADRITITKQKEIDEICKVLEEASSDVVFEHYSTAWSACIDELNRYVDIYERKQAGAVKLDKTNALAISDKVGVVKGFVWDFAVYSQENTTTCNISTLKSVLNEMILLLKGNTLVVPEPHVDNEL